MRIGIIGNWGHHVDVLAETDLICEATVVGLAPGYAGEDLCTLRTAYPATRVYECHRCLLDEAKPDVVLISTRLDLIPKLAIETASAGFNSICEKPLALDQTALRRLWDAVAVNRTQCLAMLPNRTHPVLAQAKRLVDSGRIGEVKLLNARKSYRCKDQPTGWLGRRATYGGTLPWIGIHALDCISFVSGSGFRSVCAFHANVAHPLQPEREDICTMNLQLQSGAIATASIDYLRPLSASTHGDDWLRIVGPGGSIEAAIGRGFLTIIDADGVEHVTDFPDGQPYYTPILRALPEPGQSNATAETCRSFALTYAALCARDAADQGRVVTELGGPWDEPLPCATTS